MGKRGIDYQLQDYPDDAIAGKQRELNTAYDEFCSKYGLINARANAQAFSEDSSYYLLCSLESIEKTKEKRRTSKLRIESFR